MTVSEILRQEWFKAPGERTFSPLKPFLALLSYLYACGLKIKQRPAVTLKGKSLPGFVLSLGNLTVGGTGKTPAAKMLAEWAGSRGYEVAILSRGYGGHHGGRGILEVSGKDRLHAGPQEAGDEPYLLARNLKGVPVIVAKNRRLAGLYAHRRYRSNFYILDDGFQHLALRRDLDLVLIDASNPFGNGRLLPWGPLREPLRHLQRADGFIMTHAGERSEDEALDDYLKKRLHEKPFYRSDHIPDRIILPSQNKAAAPDLLRGKRIAAFAGIAQPEKFRKTLIDLGAEPVYFRNFRDHHPYSNRELQGLIERMKGLEAEYLVTTEKDWVRLEGFANANTQLVYLTVKLSLLDREKDFYQMIENRVEQAGHG
ncbi:tetraacyldisaccharide 4'-kinase [Thermodesulfobacteriota bacterium]